MLFRRLGGGEQRCSMSEVSNRQPQQGGSEIAQSCPEPGIHLSGRKCTWRCYLINKRRCVDVRAAARFGHFEQVPLRPGRCLDSYSEPNIESKSLT
jgi:hypothetical protein